MRRKPPAVGLLYIKLDVYRWSKEDNQQTENFAGYFLQTFFSDRESKRKTMKSLFLFAAMLPMAGSVRVLWHWFWLFSARTCSISYFFPAHQVCYYYDQGTIILISLSPGQTIATCQHNISQHCWEQHVACVWPPCCDVLQHVGCYWLKFESVKFELTTPNMSQHEGQTHATYCAQPNVGICCVGMLRSFGRGFT